MPPAPLKRVGQAEQSLGPSRGGFSTKIYVSVDALAKPLRFRSTGGQRHDITQAEALVAELEFERLIANRSYNEPDFIESLLAAEVEVVTPPRRNRKEQREYDAHWYKERLSKDCINLTHFVMWVNRIG